MKLNRVLVVLLAFLIAAATPSKSTDSEEKTETVVLSKDNTLVLNEEVDGASVGKIIANAMELDRGLNTLKSKIKGEKKPLYLFLNTPGGSIQSGLEMIEALNGLGRSIHTVTLFAASMGFQIAQNLGDRLVLKNGVLMSHRAAGEFVGAFGGPSPSQIESRYKLWMSRLTELDQQTVKRTKGKQTLQSYQKEYADEMWLTGTQAVTEGYADRVVLVKCDETLAGATTHSIDFFGVEIHYDLDNCPLNTSPMNIKIVAPQGKVIYTSEQKVDMIKKFKEQFDNKQKQVVPMYW